MQNIRKTGLFLLISFLNILSIFASDPDLANPTQTAFTQIFYLQNNSYDIQRSAKTIFGKKGEAAEALTLKLKLYFDAKLMYIDTAIYPNNSNYRDSSTSKHIFYPFPDNKAIYLQKINGNWYYSPYTISQIELLYNEAMPFGSDLLISLFGKWGQQVFLNFKVWQWLGLILLITLVLTLFRLQWWIIDKVAIGLLFAKKSKSDRTVKIIRSFAKYGSVFLLIHYTREFFPALQFPVKINLFVLRGLDLTGVVFLILVLHTAIDILMIRYTKLMEERDSTMAQQFRPVLQKLLQGASIVFGAVLMLKSLGVNLGALLAGVSIAGLAFALAAQDTVKNFFGSVMIFLDQPFKVGDWIRVDGVDGTVELVSLRATRVRTFENSLVYIPNGKLADAMVNNYGLRVYRRYNTQIAVTYDTAPELIEAYVDGLRALVANHPDTRKDFYLVYLNAFGDSSLNIIFYIFFEVPDWKEELRARHEIILGAVELANKLGVRFAFPTSTIHIENMPNSDSLTPKFTSNHSELAQKTQDFMADYKLKYPTNKQPEV
jgi:MscS family membrane protein